MDISGQLAGLISGSKVFGGSPNIRHGKYPKLMIERIFADLVQTQQNDNHRMAFWEFRVVESQPNQQIEGDQIGRASCRERV